MPEALVPGGLSGFGASPLSIGGFGHLLIMGQAGFLEHDETVLGIRTFARDVYPRVKQDFQTQRSPG